MDNTRYRHFYDYIFKRNVKRSKNIWQENHRGRVNNLLVEYNKKKKVLPQTLLQMLLSEPSQIKHKKGYTAVPL